MINPLCNAVQAVVGAVKTVIDYIGYFCNRAVQAICPTSTLVAGKQKKTPPAVAEKPMYKRAASTNNATPNRVHTDRAPVNVVPTDLTLNALYRHKQDHLQNLDGKVDVQSWIERERDSTGEQHDFRYTVSSKSE